MVEWGEGEPPLTTRASGPPAFPGSPVVSVGSAGVLALERARPARPAESKRHCKAVGGRVGSRPSPVLASLREVWMTHFLDAINQLPSLPTH